jgi:dolichol kinase
VTDRAPREGLRRAVHVLTGLALALTSTLLSHTAMTLVLLGILPVTIILELLRRRSPALQAILTRLSLGALRPSEARGVTGAAVLAAGIALAWLIFPAVIAQRSILVVATADPAASAIGTWLNPPGRKTIAGSLACLVTALLALLITRTSLPIASIAAVAATIAERMPGRALDNITVPLVTGAVLLALS